MVEQPRQGRKIGLLSVDGTPVQDSNRGSVNGNVAMPQEDLQVRPKRAGREERHHFQLMG